MELALPPPSTLDAAQTNAAAAPSLASLSLSMAASVCRQIVVGSGS